MADVPDGFVPFDRSSPFLETVGPLYWRDVHDSLEFGFLAEEKHCNSRGLVHGGFLSTVADIALGYGVGNQSDGTKGLITTSITIDFAGSAREGDWVVFKTDVQKVGRQAAFANTYGFVGDKRIVRASGIFSVIDPRP
ncbi:MAG: PaaI family thioesterase [Pseudomonadota bacterium]